MFKLGKKSVQSIMGDFGKKIKDLEEVKEGEIKEINKREETIIKLKVNNLVARDEINAADKAIRMLSQFV